MRHRSFFPKLLIGAFLISALSGCGGNKDIDYIQENGNTQEAVPASTQHVNYTITNGRTTANIDANVDTSLSTQAAPVATVVRCDYTNEDITRIAAAIFDEGSYELCLPYCYQTQEAVKAACDAFEEAFAGYSDSSEIPASMLEECFYAQNARDEGGYNPIDTDGSLIYYPIVKPNADSQEFSNYCNIKGTINGTTYYLSFVQTRKHAAMVLHRDYTEVTAYGFYNQDSSAIYPDALEKLSSDETTCTYSAEAASAIVTDTLSTMGIDDYTITDVLPAVTSHTNYTISKSYEVLVASSQFTYDSCMLYGGRTLDGLTPVYTTENFEQELTDYDSMEQDANGTISNYEDSIFYGYEAVTANVDNNGLNYLIIQNPMKVEEVQTEDASTLDFSQIDIIAQDYINKHTFHETVYNVSAIRYGLIRIANDTDDSYQLLPAWYYLYDNKEENGAYYYPSTYVIINAIDGSIFNNELGYIYQHRNKSD